MPRRPVPAGRDEAIVAAYVADVRTADIAAKHGLNFATVANILRRSPEAMAHRNGGTLLERRVRAALDPAVPVGDIAAAAGCGVDLVYAVARRDGVRVGTLRDNLSERIRSLLDGTRTAREIAEKVGTTQVYVGLVARAAGLRAAPAPSKAAMVRRLVHDEGLSPADAAAAVGWRLGRAMEALRRSALGHAKQTSRESA